MEALWSAENHTIYSSLLNVPAGKAAVLFATGLKCEAHRATASIKKPQFVCVQRVLFGFDATKFSGAASACCTCDVDERYGEEVVADYVMTCGKPWRLSNTRNIAVIPLPGIYRLQLNDSTAIGVAQVYVDFYDIGSIPLQSMPLFFD